MIKSCCVCEKDNASYKCPTCRKPYCSVICCKTHKTQVCKLLELPKVPKEPKKYETTDKEKYKFPTEDTVPMDKLQQLRHSKELKECLQNPHVRDIIVGILNDPNPTEAIASAMTETIFVEMADACLKVVEPPDEDKPC